MIRIRIITNMTQPLFPSTISTQSRDGKFLTIKTVVRPEKQPSDGFSVLGQAHAWAKGGGVRKMDLEVTIPWHKLANFCCAKFCRSKFCLFQMLPSAGTTTKRKKRQMRKLCWPCMFAGFCECCPLRASQKWHLSTTNQRKTSEGWQGLPVRAARDCSKKKMKIGKLKNTHRRTHYTLTNTRIHSQTYARTHTHTQTHARTRTRTHVHTHKYTPSHTETHTSTHTHTRRCRRIGTQTYTHSNKTNQIAQPRRHAHTSMSGSASIALNKAKAALKTSPAHFSSRRFGPKSRCVLPAPEGP